MAINLLIKVFIQLTKSTPVCNFKHGKSLKIVSTSSRLYWLLRNSKVVSQHSNTLGYGSIAIFKNSTARTNCSLTWLSDIFFSSASLLDRNFKVDNVRSADFVFKYLDHSLPLAGCFKTPLSFAV